MYIELHQLKVQMERQDYHDHQRKMGLNDSGIIAQKKLYHSALSFFKMLPSVSI